MISKVWTILDIINWGKGFFAEKGIESPRLNIELLLCHVLNIDRISIYSNFDYPLKEKELAPLRDAVKRRARREPLQYITGWTEFYGNRINVKPGVLIPRPETEQMVEMALEKVKGLEEPKILEIGTGSGCISIALAKNLKNAEIIATDVSDIALDQARNNAILSNADRINFIRHDILNDSINGIFDMIISNPPYIPYMQYQSLEPEVLKFEPENALTDFKNGTAFYERFVEIFKDMLSENSFFILEADPSVMNEVEKMFQENAYCIEIKEDYAGLQRFVSGINKKLTKS